MESSSIDQETLELATQGTWIKHGLNKIQKLLFEMTKNDS